MTLERRLELMDAAYAEIRAMAAAKSADYAPGKDTLANFKSGAQTCRLSPFQYLFALVTKQWDAISTAIDANPAYPKTSFESLKDKMRDVVAYTLLLECLLEELKPEEAEPAAAGVKVNITVHDGDRFAYRRFHEALQRSGGLVDRNRPYIVGESGPEVFVPNDRPKLTIVDGGLAESVCLVPLGIYARFGDGSPVRYVGIVRDEVTEVELHRFVDLIDGAHFDRDFGDVSDIVHAPESA